MRTTSFLALALLSACGGNWSNSDLVFVNALPRATDLKSEIPVSTASPLSGVGTREDGLDVGAPSSAYAQSKKAAADYNTNLVALLGLVDQIRMVAPTTRSLHSRTWGPFDDPNNVGRQIQVTISNTADAPNQFTWSIDSRAANELEFLHVIFGTFVANETAVRGHGEIHVPVKSFRDVVKVDDGFKQVDQLDITYATDQDPRDVRMHLELVPGNSSGFDRLDVASQQYANGAGAIRFLISTPGPAITKARIDSGWLPSGAGKSVSTVLEGTVAGSTITECWSDTFTVRAYVESWPGGEMNGSLGDCAAPQLIP